MKGFNRTAAEGHALVEYALSLVPVALVAIVGLLLLGELFGSAFGVIAEELGFSPSNHSDTDLVVITKADYRYDNGELHLEVTANGGYDPDVTLTAWPGGVMQAGRDHYYLKYSLTGCPCTVTVNSNRGGSESVVVGQSVGLVWPPRE